VQPEEEPSEDMSMEVDEELEVSVIITQYTSDF
jgi:hypothetical protein